MLSFGFHFAGLSAGYAARRFLGKNASRANIWLASSLKDHSLALPVVQCLKTVSLYNLSSFVGFIFQEEDRYSTS